MVAATITQGYRSGHAKWIETVETVNIIGEKHSSLYSAVYFPVTFCQIPILSMFVTCNNLMFLPFSSVCVRILQLRAKRPLTGGCSEMAAVVNYSPPWWVNLLHRLPHFNMEFQIVSSDFRPEDSEYQKVRPAPGGGGIITSHSECVISSFGIT